MSVTRSTAHCKVDLGRHKQLDYDALAITTGIFRPDVFQPMMGAILDHVLWAWRSIDDCRSYRIRVSLPGPPAASHFEGGNRA